MAQPRAPVETPALCPGMSLRASQGLLRALGVRLLCVDTCPSSLPRAQFSPSPCVSTLGVATESRCAEAGRRVQESYGGFITTISTGACCPSALAWTGQCGSRPAGVGARCRVCARSSVAQLLAAHVLVGGPVTGWRGFFPGGVISPGRPAPRTLPTRLCSHGLSSRGSAFGWDAVVSRPPRFQGGALPCDLGSGMGPGNPVDFSVL